MSPGIGFSYLLIFCLSCVEYFFHYKFINYLKPNLTQKQKAYILSIKSSLTLFLIGLYFNYYYFTSGFNQETFLNILETHDSLNFGKLVVLYFAAYLIMDIYIGNREYPEYMKQLSGNIHHFVYVLINLLSLYTGLYPIYLLHMLSELPTFLLSIGSFDPVFRHDNWFGITFFLTRILYQSILMYIFKDNKTLLFFGLAALALHIYWFSGWFKKYGKKLFKTDIKDCSSYHSKKKVKTSIKKKNKISLKTKKIL